MNKVLFLFLAVFAFWFVFVKSDEIRLGPGVLAPNLPLQEDLSSNMSFTFKDYRVTPLAGFQINAKVLSREDYSYGREAEISPTDLALGWRRMSDEDVISRLSISQSNRWYRWKTDKFPIPRREIETSSANMHMIPRDEGVESVLKRIRKGDIISLKGKLVRVNAPDGWHWISSLSRSDTGSGACEVIFVEEISIEDFSQ